MASKNDSIYIPDTYWQLLKFISASFDAVFVFIVSILSPWQPILGRQVCDDGHKLCEKWNKVMESIKKREDSIFYHIGENLKLYVLWRHN